MTSSYHKPPVAVIAAAAVLMIMLLAAHWQTVHSADVLFQLRAGDVIYNSRQIPNRDIFSAGSRAGEWVFFEWLWSAVLSAAGRAGEFLSSQFSGFKPGQWLALSALNLVLALLVYGLTVFRLRKRQAGWLETFAITAMTATALLPEFQPEAAFAVLPLYVLSLRVSEAQRRWPLVLLPPVVALWANLHSSVLLALVAPVVHFVFPADEKPRRAFLAIVIGSSILAIFITPNSVRIIPAMLDLARVQVAGAWTRLDLDAVRITLVMQAVLLVVMLMISAVGHTLNRRDVLNFITLVAAFTATGGLW